MCYYRRMASVKKNTRKKKTPTAHNRPSPKKKSTTLSPKKSPKKTIRKRVSSTTKRTPRKASQTPKSLKAKAVKTNKQSKTINVKRKSGTIYSQSLLRSVTFPKFPIAKTLLTFKVKVVTHPLSALLSLIKKVLYPLWVFVSALKSYPWRTAFSLGLTIAIVVSSYTFYTSIFVGLPSPEELITKEQPLTTRILDRNGKMLYRVYEHENRTLVPLSAVSPAMIHATIAIEDQSFYEHRGISVKGITRAFIANTKGEVVQGGSTITQQLVKNRLLSPERTWTRKIKEGILAILVEGNYSKDQILEMYLNQVAYGGSTYGIEEAAHRYFDKAAKDLTLAESSLLAGLPAAPSVFTPFGPNPDLAKARQAEVLRRMVEDGYISQEEADLALQEELSFRTNTIDIQAPHFVMYVKQLLAEQYGEDLVNRGGLEVRTTIDLDLQQQVQTQVSSEVEKLKGLKINNGAALVTNPQTGEILAMVGSTNYFDFVHDGQVNVVLRPRQPGSSIKPLTYSLALERGLRPETKILDAPITFQSRGSEPYSPKNYDGRYHGQVTLREALASSYNIPAVKIAAQLGVDSLINKGKSMGITTWEDRNRFGLSLTLGGGEVRMIDLAEMYSTFANYGYTVSPSPLLEIRDGKGELLYQNTCALSATNCKTRRTLSPLVAYQITNILSDNRARTPAFGAHSVLAIPDQEVAVKTGTTNSLRDNWTIGYTQDRLVAVWVGNNDNSPMSYVASGITGASPIWNSIMRLLLDEENPHAFAAPDGFVKVAVCTQTGTLPCNACPRSQVREELFVPGTEPTNVCNPSMFIPLPSPSPISQL